MFKKQKQEKQNNNGANVLMTKQSIEDFKKQFLMNKDRLNVSLKQINKEIKSILKEIGCGKKILAIDEEKNCLSMIRDFFEKNQPDWKLLTYSNIPEALTAIKNFTPDIVIIDLGISNIDGDKLVQFLDKETKVIMVADDKELKKKSIKENSKKIASIMAHPCSILRKPITAIEIGKAVSFVCAT